MSTLEVCIEGIGFWAPGWADWTAARAGLRGEAQADASVIKPTPSLLAAAERRRAPLPVLLACEISAQACAASGHALDSLPSVFASTHGDLVITDYMCATLASAPRELSPIRFHNSVHNAPAGYWTIAAHCHAGSTSISSWHSTFGVALFEAAVQANAEHSPVLLAAYDAESPGPLAAVSPSSCVFGVALVIAPAGEGRASLRLSFNGPAAVASPATELAQGFSTIAAANPMALQSLPLLAAIAAGGPMTVDLSAGTRATLRAEIGA
jgi:hypothetical protein